MIVRLKVVKKNRRNAKLILRWENSIRRDKGETLNSITTHVIKWKEHWEWFINKESRYYYFICIAHGGRVKKVGTVSFDTVKSRSTYITSILVNKPWRRRGIGVKALKNACRKLKSREPGARIIAKIFSHNLASINCFTRAGFQKAGEDRTRRRRLLVLRWIP